MKYLLAAALIATSLACSKKAAPVATTAPSIPKDAPACIQQKIKTILAEPVRNPPTRILQLTYNGAPAYYITAACCDQFTEVYDKACNLICHPDGGITGRGDGHCPAFWSTATDSVEIWRDAR